MNISAEARLRAGWDTALSIMQGLRSSGLVRRAYPSLFRGGVASGALHSYMLSALLLLGDGLGYSAVIDSPVFDRLDNTLLGEGSKRPDSIWFEQGTETVRVLFEFERYTGNSLEPKVRNLLVMANSCPYDIHLLVLMYWTFRPRSLAELRAPGKAAERGFHSKGCRFGPALSPMLFVETIVRQHPKNLAVDGFVAKRFFYGGENKNYILADLN